MPNPSFEDTIPCTTSMISPNLAAVGWYSVNQSPDYYNNIYSSLCGYNSSYLPNYCIDGEGMIGFATYASSLSNFRELTQTQLSSSLIMNKKYIVSFYVNLWDNCDFATDDIGAALTPSSSIPLGYSNQINNPSGNFITDTVNWTLITGIMTAAGGEQYITIGNFKNDVNTTVITNNPGSPMPNTYYFADMVSVYELPDIEAGISDTICLGDTVQLNASYANGWAGLKYRWFPSVGLSDTTILNPVAAPTVTTTYYFGLIDTTGTIPGMSQYKDSLTIMVGCSGIEEQNRLKYSKLYPNPANTVAYYELELAPNEKGRLEFYDLLGNLVFEQTLIAGSTRINLSEISCGVYLYKVIINNEYKASNKVIITK